jgi:hypothetical protein
MNRVERDLPWGASASSISRKQHLQQVATNLPDKLSRLISLSTSPTSLQIQMSPPRTHCNRNCLTRSGVASVEKAIVVAAIAGMLSLGTWTLSAPEFNTLTNCSSSIENSLCPTSKTVMSSPVSPRKTEQATGPNDFLAQNSQSAGIIALAFVVGFGAVGLWRRRRKNKLFSESKNPIEQVKKQLEPTLIPGCVFTKRQQTMAILLNRLGKEAFEEMKIGHLISKKVKSLPPSAPLEEVRRWFFTHHFRHILVCDSAGELKGIICSRDMQRANRGTASDVMTTNLITASSHHLVGPTITMMMERRISCLPVVDNQRLVGVVTTTDLLIALQCTLQILQSLGSFSAPTSRKPCLLRNTFAARDGQED